MTSWSDDTEPARDTWHPSEPSISSADLDFFSEDGSQALWTKVDASGSSAVTWVRSIDTLYPAVGANAVKIVGTNHVTTYTQSSYFVLSELDVGEVMRWNFSGAKSTVSGTNIWRQIKYHSSAGGEDIVPEGEINAALALWGVSGTFTPTKAGRIEFIVKMSGIGVGVVWNIFQIHISRTITDPTSWSND